MAHQLFFLCPNCFAEDSLSRSVCRVCNASFKIQRQSLSCNGEWIGVQEYYQFLLQRLKIDQSSADFASASARLAASDLSGALRISYPAVLRQGKRGFRFSGYHGVFSRALEIPRPVARGRLAMFQDRAEFLTPAKNFSWNLADFTCVTTNGHYFEFKVKGQPFFQIRFLQESVLKYEILFRKQLDALYNARRLHRIVEYQPRVRGDFPRPGQRFWNLSASREPVKPYVVEKILMGSLRRGLKRLLQALIVVEIRGTEHWQREARGFALMNHQSALDPFIAGAFWDHRIAFLAKSSSFAHRLPRLFLKWAMCLPTTRYQNDSEVIFAAKALLRRGIKVGIFPEGERCWDGRMQPFKLNVVKLLAASREAIFPVVIQNAFQFWPRWAKFPRRARVTLSFLAPFCLLPGLYSLEEQRRFLEALFRAELKET